jgi:hypothetical protein
LVDNPPTGHRLDQITEFAKVVIWTIGLNPVVSVYYHVHILNGTHGRSVTMGPIKIWFVSCLKSDEIIAQDSLALFCNRQSEVGGVVEWNSEMPSDVYEGRDVSEHPK